MKSSLCVSGEQYTSLCITVWCLVLLQYCDCVQLLFSLWSIVILRSFKKKQNQNLYELIFISLVTMSLIIPVLALFTHHSWIVFFFFSFFFSRPFLQFIKIILNPNPGLRSTCSLSQPGISSNFSKHTMFHHSNQLQRYRIMLELGHLGHPLDTSFPLAVCIVAASCNAAFAFQKVWKAMQLPWTMRFVSQTKRFHQPLWSFVMRNKFIYHTDAWTRPVMCRARSLKE